MSVGLKLNRQNYHVSEELSCQVAQRAVNASGLFAPSIAEAAPGTAGLNDEAAAAIQDSTEVHASICVILASKISSGSVLH
jgi:hypothetical protein